MAPKSASKSASSSGYVSSSTDIPVSDAVLVPVPTSMEKDITFQMKGDMNTISVGFKEMIEETEEKDMPTVIANLREETEKKVLEYEYAKSIMEPTEKKVEKNFKIIVQHNGIQKSFDVTATTTATSLRDASAKSFGYKDGFSNLNLFYGNTKITQGKRANLQGQKLKQMGVVLTDKSILVMV